MSEVARIIAGLKAAGWDSESIVNFLLWIGTGEEKYKPGKREQNTEANP